MKNIILRYMKIKPYVVVQKNKKFRILIVKNIMFFGKCCCSMTSNKDVKKKFSKNLRLFPNNECRHLNVYSAKR